MLLGIVLWTFFSEITANGLSSVVSRGDVIRKINFPKYVIVIASSVSALINLFLNFIIIGVFLIINGVDIHWSALIAPVYILEIFIFGLGLAFILSTLFVKLRDVNYIWEILMQALFYGSAVIYPIAVVIDQAGVEVARLLLLNPVAQAIQDTRQALVDPSTPTLYSISGSVWMSLIPIAAVIVVFIIGAVFFRKRSPYFAEEV